jgi:hypothetical protein
MTDKVKMKALDTLHISNVQADNLLKDDTFEVSETDAKQLEERGLAKRMGKAEKAAPENKMEAAPANKAPISARSTPTRAKATRRK